MTNQVLLQPNLYETNKLNLAAYLITCDATTLVQAYCHSNNGLVTFTLSPTPTPEQIAAFYNGKGIVSGLVYYNTLSNLKAAVFEAKRIRRSLGNGKAQQA